MHATTAFQSSLVIVVFSIQVYSKRWQATYIWYWKAFLRYAYITHLKHVQVACMVKCSKLGKINMFYLNVKCSEPIPPIQYTIELAM